MEGLQKSIVMWRNRRSISSNQYRTMTVQFNITETPGYGTYLNDASDMPYGKESDAISAWQEFFGYKPCLFKNGRVVGYLNPNDYTKFENGTSADITSGNAGDVMVEFPRRGIKISKYRTTVTVSMTDNPNAEGYSYLAHTRGSTAKDYFYIGAYLGYNASSKLRSLSGKMPTSLVSLSDFRTYARNLGTGYMEVGFYQYLFIQCMYLLQYKGHLNSQSVHGYGYCDARDRVASNTGFSDTKGVMYGTTNKYYSTESDHIKLFGIEDFWGNLEWYLDGYYVAGNAFRASILTATDGFNNTGSGYTTNGYAKYISNGCISDAVCSSKAGFTPTNATTNGNSVYFCDTCAINSNATGEGYAPSVGGDYHGDGGIFHFIVSSSPTSRADWTGGRLAYL